MPSHGLNVVCEDDRVPNNDRLSGLDSSFLHMERDGAHCSVLVRDQGPGIPEGERHKLFKDFGQTSVKPTAGEKSTGLGLAICKRIMESHGGSIAAESVPAGGSVFKITFPLAA
jgi:signal transduction histidine kinase